MPQGGWGEQMMVGSKERRLAQGEPSCLVPLEGTCTSCLPSQMGPWGPEPHHVIFMPQLLNAFVNVSLVLCVSLDSQPWVAGPALHGYSCPPPGRWL